MFSYIWPIALVVLSNTVYQICAKSMPNDLNPFAALIFTYLTGAAVAAVLYFSIGGGGSLVKEAARLNWVPFVLGLVIVGLEVGFIYAYKAGWQVSTASVVQNAFVTVALLGVGALLYHEGLSWNKLLGAAICMAGLAVINL